MGNIRKDFPNIKVLTSKDFDYFYNKEVRAEKSRTFKIGQTCRLIGLPDLSCQKFMDIDYRYYRHKDSKLLKRVEIEEDKLSATKFYYPKGQDYRVLVFGDSSIENLMEFLPYNLEFYKEKQFEVLFE